MRVLRGLQLALLLAAAVGCRTTQEQGLDVGERRMMSLLLPSRIEIVEPFTSIRRLGREGDPQGIELMLQAVNALDNPGLMIVGRVRAELFEFVPASAEPKGRRIDHWNVELATTEQQRQYWDEITQMYRFRLAIETEGIPRAGQYLLLVTYVPPMGPVLTDECALQVRGDRTGEESLPRERGRAHSKNSRG